MTQTEREKVPMKDSVLLKERRLEIRFSLNGLVPMRIQTDSKEGLVAMFIDASSRGVGLIVEPVLRVDEEVTLKLATGMEIPMSVRWVKKPVGLSNPNVPIFHRAGLCITDHPDHLGVDLIKILEQFDCVDH